MFYILCPFGHLIAVPAWAVGIRHLHLRIELTAVGEVVHRLEGESGLIPGEVQREIHYKVYRRKTSTGMLGENKGRIKLNTIILGKFSTLLPCTRKQKSFHIRSKVSLVNPSASYSTTPLKHITLLKLLSHINY